MAAFITDPRPTMSLFVHNNNYDSHHSVLVSTLWFCVGVR